MCDGDTMQLLDGVTVLVGAQWVFRFPDVRFAVVTHHQVLVGGLT